jgi:hypothetical protein
VAATLDHYIFHLRLSIQVQEGVLIVDVAALRTRITTAAVDANAPVDVTATVDVTTVTAAFLETRDQLG